jgi:hypothetical protein
MLTQLSATQSAFSPNEGKRMKKKEEPDHLTTCNFFVPPYATFTSTLASSFPPSSFASADPLPTYLFWLFPNCVSPTHRTISQHATFLSLLTPRSPSS